jgi:hypothetical protein
MNLVATYEVDDPQKMSLMVSACYAADKGVPTERVRHAQGWLVVLLLEDEENKAILFKRKPCGK